MSKFNGASQNLPPGPDGFPLLGNTHQLLTNDLLSWSESLTKSYGNIIQLKATNKTIILLSEPDAIEDILINNSQKYMKGGFQKFVTSSLLGNGIVLAQGDTWRTQRQALEPIFHPKQMGQFKDRIEKHTSQQMERWNDVQKLNIAEEMKDITLSVIADVLFDLDTRNESWGLKPAFSRVLKHFERIAQTYIYVPEQIPTPENLAYQQAVADLEDVVDQIITKHENNNERKPTVVTQLLKKAEEDDYWDREAIRDQIITLLLAGHETTALTLTFAAHLLGTHPDIQERTRNVVNEFDDSSIASEAPDCKQIDRVLQETFRLYPPVYAIFREPTQDVELNGYHIPEGSMIVLNQWATHRSENTFENPKQFSPDRWTNNLRSDLSPGEFFPFGGGSRRCIGERLAMLEGTIILAKILDSYQLESLSDTIEATPSLTTQPKNEITIQIHKQK